MYKNQFPKTGTQLERYAARLKCVEINSSFYRPHMRKTYERWAASVPVDFKFAVKVPRAITHNARLKDCGDSINRFLAEARGLGRKLGALLVQLPPSLTYSEETAESFFRNLIVADTIIACEARHVSWFTVPADKTLKHLGVIRVAADPPRAPEDGKPGGATAASTYWRLHGSPKIYYSDYSDAQLRNLAAKLQKQDWCIFDNTAAFCALGNALKLTEYMSVAKSS